MVAQRKARPIETPLDESLNVAEAVTEDVQRASEDLAVINTVLEQELPADLQVGDIAQAIAHTSELEKKLAESAEKLAEVNEALSIEISKRPSATLR